MIATILITMVEYLEIRGEKEVYRNKMLLDGKRRQSSARYKRWLTILPILVSISEHESLSNQLTSAYGLQI
jgi:hypothetical protein